MGDMFKNTVKLQSTRMKVKLYNEMKKIPNQQQMNLIVSHMNNITILKEEKLTQVILNIVFYV